MGMFSNKKQPESDGNWQYRGGCSACRRIGPARNTMTAASQDVYRHGQLRHGSKTFRGGYLEPVKRGK